MKIYTSARGPQLIYPHIRLIRLRSLEGTYSTPFVAFLNLDAEEKTLLGVVRIGFFGQKENDRLLLDPAMDELPENYFSLGQGVAYYERIAKINKSAAKEILEPMRDLAFNKEILQAAKNEPVFRRSLARQLGAVKSLNFFNKKTGRQPSQLAFEYGCSLNGARSLTTCTFSFDKANIINGAINVLIGKNGCGKSQYLANLVASLTGENLVGKFSNDDRQQFDKVIAVSYSMFDRFFLPDDIKIAAGKKRNQFLSDQLRYKYIGMRDKTGANAVKVASPAALSSRFSTALENITKKRELTRWKQIMSPVLRDAELNIVSDSPAVIRRNFRRLGAGHKATLSILTGLFDELVPNSLVVVDEPENHLHPALLGHLIEALQNMLVFKQSVAIVATHSPIIVQEFPSKFVRVIRKIEGTSQITPLRERSFGRSLDSIVSSVFGVPAEAPGYMNLLQNLVKLGWSLQKIEENIGEELGPAARSFVISEQGGA